VSRIPRNAAAGLALAAAGVLYRRLTGRRGDQTESQPPPSTPAPSSDPDRAGDVEVAQARTALADELARRAAE
jgi:hypothetical protein